MYLSVVIPAFNEALRLPKSLEVISKYLEARWPGKWEIIVSDDGSTDETLKVVESFAKSYPNIRAVGYKVNQGKGRAIQTGVSECKGELILINDADLATPIEEFSKLQEAINTGADIAIGSRALSDSVVLPRREWHRELLGRGSNLLIRLILGIPFHDTQCGFKLFKYNVARELFEKLYFPRWSFDFEILYRANIWGIKVIEVPVIWHAVSGSKLRTLDVFTCLSDLIKLRLLPIEKRGSSV